MGNAQVAVNCVSDSARASSIGLNVALGNIGGLISTWAFLPTDAPYYRSGTPTQTIKRTRLTCPIHRIGNGLNFACATTILLLSIGLNIWLRLDNKRRDKVDVQQALAGKSEQEIANLEHKVSPESKYPCTRH